MPACPAVARLAACQSCAPGPCLAALARNAERLGFATPATRLGPPLARPAVARVACTAALRCPDWLLVFLLLSSPAPFSQGPRPVARPAPKKMRRWICSCLSCCCPQWTIPFLVPARFGRAETQKDRALFAKCVSWCHTLPDFQRTCLAPGFPGRSFKPPARRKSVRVHGPGQMPNQQRAGLSSSLAVGLSSTFYWRLAIGNWQFPIGVCAPWA